MEIAMRNRTRDRFLKKYFKQESASLVCEKSYYLRWIFTEKEQRKALDAKMTNLNLGVGLPLMATTDRRWP
jgi:hypothetical protein